MFIISRPKAKNKSGFTLLETLLVVSIGVLISITTISIFVSGLKYIEATRNMAQLHSNAIFLSNTLTHYIKQAKTLNVDPSFPETLEIKIPDPDEPGETITKTITKEDNNITIDNFPFNADNVKVTKLNFNQQARSVKINFTLEIEDSQQDFSVSTTIAQRNIYD